MRASRSARISRIHPEIFFHQRRSRILCDPELPEGTAALCVQHHDGPVSLIDRIVHLLYRQAQCGTDRVVHQPCPRGVFQHLAQPVSAASGRDFHEIGVSVRPETHFDVIKRGPHVQQAQQPLQLRTELLLLGRRDRGRPGITHRRVGIVGFAVKILVIERDKLQFPVHREAVGIRGKALLLNKVFQNKSSAAGIFQCIPDRRFQLRRAVHPADALAARVVHGLDDQGIGKVLRFPQGVLERRKAPACRHPEAVLPQEGTEAALVLQDRYRFIRSHVRQAHLLRHICCRNHAGVTGKGHHSVHLQSCASFSVASLSTMLTLWYSSEILCA